jgi:hypothetical protein
MSEILTLLAAIKTGITVLKLVGFNTSKLEAELTRLEALGKAILAGSFKEVWSLYSTVLHYQQNNQEKTARALKAALENPAMVKPAPPHASPSSKVGPFILLLILTLPLASCCNKAHVLDLPETFYQPATETTPAVPGTWPGFSIEWPDDASKTPGDYHTVEVDGYMVTTTPKK